MKATGIVRRIDDLGRVVIPKEIRRTLRIREGDPLEIYTEKDGEVIFKKYSPMGDLTDLAAQICDSIVKNTGHIAAVCDRDTIIAASPPGTDRPAQLQRSRTDHGAAQSVPSRPRRHAASGDRQHGQILYRRCLSNSLGGRHHGLCHDFDRR